MGINIGMSILRDMIFPKDAYEIFFGKLQKALTDNLYTYENGKTKLVTDGVLRTPMNRLRPVPEGTENREYHSIGMLFLTEDMFQQMKEKYQDKANGKPLYFLEKHFHGFQDVDDRKGLEQYIESEEHQEGIHLVVDGRKVGTVHPLQYQMKDDLGLYIPPDFVYSSGNVSMEETEGAIGTKTRAGIHASILAPGSTYVAIKESGYTPLGLGKVIRAANGLKEESFMIWYDQSKSEQPIKLDIPKDVENSLMTGYLGINRNFKQDGNGLRKNSERIVYQDPLMFKSQMHKKEQEYAQRNAGYALLRAA